MRILYATDGSPGALAAARLLGALALGPETEIVVLHVQSGAAEPTPSPLETAREALGGVAAAVRTEVRRGHAAEEILRAAEELPADLIALGVSGHTGLARFLIGSVTDRVARHAPCPVLVARPGKEGLRRVLLGIDGSEAAAYAAEWLRRFPLPPECEVRVFTALPIEELVIPALPTDMPPYLITLDQIRQRTRAEALERLEATARAFQEAGKRAVTELRDGDPATLLIEAAREEGADLIVVGRHGMSALERFLLGSVSERVLRHAPCSVLIVREPAGPREPAE